MRLASFIARASRERASADRVLISPGSSSSARRKQKVACAGKSPLARSHGSSGLRSGDDGSGAMFQHDVPSALQWLATDGSTATA